VNSKEFLSNIIKYNFTLVDEEILFGIIKGVSRICNNSKKSEIIEGSLNIFENVVRYQLPISKK
jgi:hypothetical protein